MVASRNGATNGAVAVYNYDQTTRIPANDNNVDETHNPHATSEYIECLSYLLFDFFPIFISGTCVFNLPL